MICSSRKLRKTKTEFLNILWLEELLSSNSGCSGFKILSGQTLRPSWPAAAQCTAEKKLCLNWKPFYCSPAVNKLPRGSSALTSNPPKPDLAFSHPRVSLILLALILHEHELRTNPCGVVFTFSPNILLKHGIYGVRS